MSQSPGERIAELRASLRKNQRDFAAMLGYSQGQIGGVEKGHRQPSRALLERLHERMRVNPDWVLNGREPMIVEHGKGFAGRASDTRIEPADYSRPLAGDFSMDGEEFAMIRRFEVDASAGPGVIRSEEGDAVADQIAFSRTWLRRHSVNSDLSGIIRVNGTSMQPTIRDGSLVVVDFSAVINIRDGIYIYRMEETVFIKRLAILERDPTDRPTSILIISDESADKPRKLEGDGLSSFRPIGRVAAVLTSF